MAQKVILVIDDDEDILESIKLVLEMLGYRVVTAKNHLEKWDMLPDLILLDFLIPSGFDGKQVINEFRSRKELNSIPIILFSAINNIEVVAKSIKADDYLEKPFSIQALRQKLDLHLETDSPLASAVPDL